MKYHSRRLPPYLAIRSASRFAIQTTRQKKYRYITLGMSNRFRPVMVSHTDRGGRVRIISARPMTRTEREAYEEQIKD